MEYEKNSQLLKALGHPVRPAASRNWWKKEECPTHGEHA